MLIINEGLKKNLISYCHTYQDFLSKNTIIHVINLLCIHQNLLLNIQLLLGRAGAVQVMVHVLLKYVGDVSVQPSLMRPTTQTPCPSCLGALARTLSNFSQNIFFYRDHLSYLSFYFILFLKFQEIKKTYFLSYLPLNNSFIEIKFWHYSSHIVSKSVGASILIELCTRLHSQCWNISPTPARNPALQQAPRLLSSRPQQPLFSFPSLQICLFQALCISGITWHNNVLYGLGLFRVVPCMNTSFLFIAK